MSKSIESGKCYVFMNWNSRTVLDLAGGGSSDNTHIYGWQSNLPYSRNQIWKAIGIDNQWFALQNLMSGTYMTLTGSDQGSDIVGTGGNADEEKQWADHIWGNETKHTYSFYLQNRKWRDRVVDLDDAKDDDGARIAGYAKKDAQAQRFIAIQVPGV